MKTIELEAGRYRLPKITEPTHIRSLASWDVILEPRGGNIHAVVSDAPIRISRCQIRHAENTGIQVLDGALCEIEECWIHSNTRHGVNVTGPARVHRSLIERNGVHAQFHHQAERLG